MTNTSRFVHADERLASIVVLERLNIALYLLHHIWHAHLGVQVELLSLRWWLRQILLCSYLRDTLLSLICVLHNVYEGNKAPVPDLLGPRAFASTEIKFSWTFTQCEV